MGISLALMRISSGCAPFAALPRADSSTLQPVWALCCFTRAALGSRGRLLEWRRACGLSSAAAAAMALANIGSCTLVVSSACTCACLASSGHLSEITVTGMAKGMLHSLKRCKQSTP